MRMYKFGIAVLVLVLLLAGCDKKQPDMQVDEDMPLDQVKQEAKLMDSEQLREMILKYKQAILEKEPEISKLMEELQEQPLTGNEMEIKSIQEDIAGLMTSISALKVRYQVFYDALAKKGTDMTGLTLKPQ